MAREEFVPRSFKPDSLAIINKANEIIAEYMADGFVLTLRQLYYQFVARDLIPNKQTEYKRLGSIINDGRLAGLIDWSAIEDRTRNLRSHSFWDGPQDILGSVAAHYAEDVWVSQSERIEVWIEKDALVGVIEPVCNRWRLPYFACRGYSSQSEQYSAGKRALDRWRLNRQRTVILHLGDHDPSGIDMTRDNLDRLEMFTGYRDLIEVRRLALNYDQVEEYGPPPNPAKESDSRAEAYIERFGDSSWELDALDPHVIDAVIDDAVQERLNHDAWERALAEEQKTKETLRQLLIRWPDVATFLRDED